MKKIISLILTLALCLSLCACVKSAEAKAVDELILAIGEVTVDSASSIEKAVEAYNALTDKDREDVENYETLMDAQEELEIAQEKLFYEEYYNLANKLLEVYYSCQSVTYYIKSIWETNGSSGFWTCCDTVRKFNLGLTRAEYEELMGYDYVTAALALAGYGLGVLSEPGFRLSSSEQDETIELCHKFNDNIELISGNMVSLSDEVREFKSKYDVDYEDEVDTLSEICLEIDMYADFTLEPAGSLSSYTSSDNEYNNTIDRLIKILDSYR